MNRDGISESIDRFGGYDRAVVVVMVSIEYLFEFRQHLLEMPMNIKCSSLIRVSISIECRERSGVQGRRGLGC